MGIAGPLPNPNARRRNLRPAPTGTVALAKPSIPKELQGEARAEWRRVTAHLEEVGAVAKVDRAILIRYCRAWAEWVELDRQLEATGKLVRGRMPNMLVRNPLSLLRRDAEMTLQELGRELAVSPWARLRLGIQHERTQAAVSSDAPASLDEYRAMFKPS